MIVSYWSRPVLFKHGGKELDRWLSGLEWYCSHEEPVLISSAWVGSSQLSLAPDAGGTGVFGPCGTLTLCACAHRGGLLLTVIVVVIVMKVKPAWKHRPLVSAPGRQRQEDHCNF